MVQCKNVLRPARVRFRVRCGNACNWVSVQDLSLSRGIDVFGLGQAGQLILVAWQAAEEDGTADAQDGGAPAEAIGPGVVIVAFKDLVLEFDGVDDQSNDLKNHNKDQQCSYEGQKRDVERAAQCHTGDDEGDDEYDEADDHQSSHCLGPGELHERPAVPVVIPASVLVPHIGVVRLGVLVLDPSRGGGDGDYVKNNGEEQQQGHDPPASGVGDPTAKHDRRSECVERRGEDGRAVVARSVVPSGYIAWCLVRLCAKAVSVRGCGASTR